MYLDGIINGTSVSVPLEQIGVTGSSETGEITILNYALGTRTVLTAVEGATAQITSQTTLSGWTSAIGGHVSGAILNDMLSTTDDQSSTSQDTYLASGGYEVNAAAVLHTTVQGVEFLFIAHKQGTGISTFSVASNGTLNFESHVNDRPTTHAADICALATVSIDTTTYLFTASSSESGLTSYEVTASGDLIVTGSVGVEQLLPVQTITQLQPISISGNTYLLVSASDSSSLTVLSVDHTGALTIADHVIDSVETRFQNAAVLEVVETSGRVFVLAAGSDDGITLMTLLPDGTLITLGNIEDTSQSSLQNISSLTAIVVGNELQIFATSSSEIGVTQLTYDIASLGDVLSESSGPLNGTQNDDILQLTGSGQISAGAGDDILKDGVGENTLIGGAGADVFMLTQDDGLDEILDFEVGIDQLNLSLWPLLYDTSQLVFHTMSSGVIITYGDETVRITNATGAPLSQADINASISFDLSHYSVDLNLNATANPHEGAGGGTSNIDVLIGSSGDDLIEGLGASDHIEGGDGHDIIYGGDGNDGLLGQTGNDTLYGEKGDDNIAASDGDDVVYGGDGNDQIGGGDGNDTLYGESDNDVIGGGRGDDLIIAGYGNDIVSGGYGADDVRGETGHDTLAGSYGNDTIYGGSGDDSLGGGRGHDVLYGGTGNDDFGGGAEDDLIYGEEGNDFLAGGDGNDSLHGGIGDDTLNGGEGNDDLSGGSGSDIFVFNEHTAGEIDTILDFDVSADFLRFQGISGANNADRFNQFDISATGSDSELSYNQHRIILKDIDISDISLDLFLFV